MPRFRRVRGPRTDNPYTNIRVWPTGPGQVANELPFSETYRDIAAPGEVPPPGAPQALRQRLPRVVARTEEPGGVVDNVPVGLEPAQPVVRQARFVNLTVEVIGGQPAVQLLAANQRRTYLIVQNNGGATVFVTFDRPASLSAGIQIVGGINGSYEPLTPPVSSVWAVALAGINNVVIVEGTT